MTARLLESRPTEQAQSEGPPFHWIGSATANQAIETITHATLQVHEDTDRFAKEFSQTLSAEA